MKTGRTLVELAQEVERQANAKKDFISPTRSLEMMVVDDAPKLVMPHAGNVVDIQTPRNAYGINPLAHGQIAEFCGIPKNYYDRCSPALLAHNVNYWLQTLGREEKSRARLVRTLDGKVRALLSDSYRPLENYDLAEAVLPVLQDEELCIVSCEITERKLYIKAIDKRIEREIQAKGSDPAHTFLKDVVFPAITIGNSEVGFGALMVAAGIYTGGCTNFSAFNDDRMRKYHVGGKAEMSDSIYALLSDKTKRLTDAAVWSQVRDVVRGAFNVAKFEERVKRVQETADQKIVGDPVRAVEVAAVTLGLTQGESKGVLRHLIEGGNLSRYGLFNAVTRAAEDVADYDRASEFERAGGKVIELGKSDWELIAKAA